MKIRREFPVYMYPNDPDWVFTWAVQHRWIEFTVEPNRFQWTMSVENYFDLMKMFDDAYELSCLV